MAYDGDTQYDGYWLDDRTESFADRVDAHWEEAQSRLKTTRRDDRIKASIYAYNGMSRDGTWDTSQIQRSGRKGEVSLCKPNDYRSLVQQILVMATQANPAFEPRAINSDAESMHAAVIARGQLDYWMEEGGLREWRARRGEVALVTGESWLVSVWNATKGTEREDLGVADPESPDGVYVPPEGDFDVWCCDPYDVAVDPRARDKNNPSWGMFRVPMNRWDLIAQYASEDGELAQALEDAPGWGSDRDAVDSAFEEVEMRDCNEEDYVGVLLVFGAKSPALPKGRQAMRVLGAEKGGRKVVLADGPLSYRRVPAFRCVPNDIIRGQGGYSPGFDLLALNDAQGAVMSQVITLMERMMPAVAVPKGSKLKVNDHQSLRELQYEGGPENAPQPLQLFAPGPEHFTLLELLNSVMERISSIPGELRGQTGAGESGKARAMVHAAANQFNQGFQRALRHGDAGLATHMVHTLRTHATTTRIVTISGRRHSSTQRSFDPREALAPIDRVMVLPADPYRDTHQGRRELLEFYMQLPGAVKGPGDIHEVLLTGRLEPIYETDFGEELFLRQLQETLADPSEQMPEVAPTDNFPRMIEAAGDVMYTFSARFDAAIVKRVGTYVQQVDRVWLMVSRQSPSLLMVRGIPPHPMAAPPAGMPGPPPGNDNGGPPQAPPGPPGPGGPGVGPPPGPPGGALPSPPQDPITGSPIEGRPMDDPASAGMGGM